MTALIAGCGGDDDEGAGGGDASSVGSEQAIVVPQDSDIRDVDDLSGRTVVVAKGTPGEEYVEGETDAGRVRKFPEGPDVVNVVRVQLVDAAVVEVQLAQDAVATSGGVEAAELSSSAFAGYRPRPGPAPRARGRDLPYTSAVWYFNYYSLPTL